MTLSLTMDRSSHASDRGFSRNPVNYLDPLDDDTPQDEVVVTTQRGICRVALVATEVGDRFRRDGVDCDAMTWMLAPRRLFGGASAIDACLERDACLRAVLIHSLGLGLDADPELLDTLADEDPADEIADETCPVQAPFGRAGEAEVGNVVSLRAHAGDGLGSGSDQADADVGGPLRLFTATVVSHDGFETVQAFHASLAHDEAEIAGRLFMRIGPASADAVIVAGFDPSDPLIGALVSPAICDTLERIGDDPGSSLAAGLDLNVEQRFYA